MDVSFAGSVEVPVPEPRPFHLALVQLSNITEDKQRNLRHAHDMILEAAAIGSDGRRLADVVVLPEYFNCPFILDILPQHAEVIGFNSESGQNEKYDATQSSSPTVRALSATAKEAGIWLIGGSMPELDGEEIFSTCPIFNPRGELVAIHRKVHLVAGSDASQLVLAEDRILSAGNSLTHVDTDYGRIGLGLCWDVRFPEPVMIAERRGCIAMVYPGAFSAHAGPMYWRILQQARALDSQMFIAMCSPAREAWTGQRGAGWWGQSSVVNPFGNVIADSAEVECIVHAYIDPDVKVQARMSIPLQSTRRFDVYPDISRPR